jgi:hypothetical protein
LQQRYCRWQLAALQTVGFNLMISSVFFFFLFFVIAGCW